MTTHTVALFGAGKIGETIAALLASSGRYRVKVCDYTLESSTRVASSYPSVCEPHVLSLNDHASVQQLLKGCDVVISALPFFCNKQVAQAAAEAGIHYVDLTEDVDTSQFIAGLAQSSKSCFIPQCGLAPGFISIAAAHLIKFFDSVDTVKMRVGALPIYPTNMLKYNLTWSTDGLINEYCNLCEVIQDGERLEVLPLEGYEHFSLDGSEYEAFNTSGGLGTLCSSLYGKVRELNYKSIRYPGHRDLVAFLLNDLRFRDDRETLKKIFERSISTTSQDKCMILVEVTGKANGRFCQKTYASTVYNQHVGTRHFGAIQVTTAAGACGTIDLLLKGALTKQHGLVCAEDIPLPEFLSNEFGRFYFDEKAMKGI
jgi:saccharopine dehydrogenase-like NADP-dependent oxidoreductase